MEEIKENEYIRTTDGKIRKHSYTDVYYGDVLIRTDSKDIIYDFEVTKHSFNIIDLIEEKDYVNGKCVYSVGTSIGNFPIINFKDGTFDIDTNIKSIVTHEQFASVEYKIGGENEKEN